MSYIEREAAMKVVADIMQDCKVSHKHRALNRNIKQIPTADVVEVVRCKDCLFAKKGFDECDIYCKLNDASFGKDAYCSYGERREE